MFVRQQINITTLSSGTTATTINIPINIEYQLVDQAELVDRVFVDVETQKAINEITDYEKVRFLPVTSTGSSFNIINKITYNVNMISGNYYNDVGFTNDDVKFQRETFKQTFLNLNFYDSDNPMSQNLVSNITIFSNSNQQIISQIPISYSLENPINNPEGFSEGYHLYDYKDELTIGQSKYLYMRANFNNAKTGTTTNMMVKNTPLPIDTLIHELYTRFILFRTNSGYYYKIDDAYQSNPLLTNIPNNVSYLNNNLEVNLYQIQAL
jgi:hypothetical protein